MNDNDQGSTDVDPRFMDEVRQMLQRRAADVPATAAEAGPTPGSGADVPAEPHAEVLTLPGRDVGLGRSDRVLHEPVTPARSTIPWTRRAGLLAAVAAVLAVAGFALVSRLGGDGVTELAVGSGDPTSVTVLLPPEDDGVTVSQFTERSGSMGDPGDWLDAYGPVDGDPATGIVVVNQVLAVPIDEVEVTPAAPLPGSTDVTEEQSHVLAALGARFESPSMITWQMPGPDPGGSGRRMTVGWHGEAVTVDHGLAVANRVAEAPDRELAGAPLPDGWARASRIDATQLAGDGYAVTLGGDMVGGLTVWHHERPLWLTLMDTGQPGVTRNYRPVEVRGTTGLLVIVDYEEDGVVTSPSLIDVLWNEGGANHGLGVQGIGVEPDDVVALADRLVEVDIETARQRYGRTDRQAVPETVPTTTAAGPATTGPATTALDDLAITTEPPVSLTAPGPGEVDRASVITSALGGTPYELGIGSSAIYGLCVGVDLDRAAAEGGHPVACEHDPLVGGGGLREIPGAGTVVFAFVGDDPEVARAELELDGIVHHGTIYRVVQFPEFAFVVFELDGVSMAGVDHLSVPGDIVLYDQSGQPLGWG